MYNEISINSKLEVVDQFVNGVSVKEILKTNNISKSTVYNWIHQYKNIVHYPNIEYRIKRVSDLEKIIENLRIELEILQIVSPISNYSNINKVKIIDNLKSKFSIQSLCRALDIRKSIYYYHSQKKETYIEKEELFYLDYSDFKQ